MNEPKTYSIKFEDGTTREYLYSPEYRTYMDEVKKQLRRNNFLLFSALVFIIVVTIIIALIYFNTGIIGRYLAFGVCT